MEWMILPYKRYADFSGRSQRREYWMFQLLFVLVLIVGAFFVFGLGTSANAIGDDQGLSAVGIAGAILVAVFALGSIIPSIGVTVRRFHDQDKSGWFYLISFIPYIGGWIVIVFMCIDGTHGENQYGLDPKGTGIDTHVFD